MRSKIETGWISGVTMAALFFVSTVHAEITHTWVGGGSSSISDPGRWNPSETPGVGDTGYVGTGTAIFYAATAYTDAALIAGESATISRGTSQAPVESHTEWTFEDQSAANLNQIFFKTGSSFDWNSSGTWSRVSGTTFTDAFFKMQLTDGLFVANMSAGLWDFTGHSDGDDDFRLFSGTFNMTGGKIVTDRRFRLGTPDAAAHFNFGGESELVLGSLDLFNDGTTFNFQGTNSVLYIAGDQEAAIRAHAEAGRIQIDGVTQSSDTSLLQFSSETIDDTVYTGISVIPEPATLGLFISSGIIALFLRRVL